MNSPFNQLSIRLRVYLKIKKEEGCRISKSEQPGALFAFFFYYFTLSTTVSSPVSGEIASPWTGVLAGSKG